MNKLLGYGFLSQVKDIWKIILASGLMGGLVFAFSLLELPLLLELFLQVLIGIVSYAIICNMLRVESFIYLKNTVLNKLKK